MILHEHAMLTYTFSISLFLRGDGQGPTAMPLSHTQAWRTLSLSYLSLSLYLSISHFSGQMDESLRTSAGCHLAEATALRGRIKGLEAARQADEARFWALQVSSWAGTPQRQKKGEGERGGGVSISRPLEP